MNKKEAASQVKKAHDLFREGEVLVKKDPAKGEEKIQEALALSLKLVEAAPNTIEAYSLVSQIFLRRGDRRNFLFYQKGYQYLKSGGQFPEPELAPSPAPVVEVISEAKPKVKKKGVEKESTTIYPPKLIPFPQPVPLLIKGECFSRGLRIPFDIKTGRKESVPFATTSFLKTLGKRKNLEPAVIRREAVPVWAEKIAALKTRKFKLRQEDRISPVFDFLIKPAIKTNLPISEFIPPVFLAEPKALPIDKDVSDLLPLPTLAIKVLLPREKTIRKEKIFSTIRPAPARNNPFLALKRMRVSGILDPPTAFFFHLREFGNMKPFFVKPRVLQLATLQIKEITPPQAVAKTPFRKARLLRIARDFFPFLPGLPMKARPVIPTHHLLFFLRKSASMRSFFVTHKILPVSPLQIKEIAPQKTTAQAHLRKTKPRQIGRDFFPFLPGLVLKTRSRPFPTQLSSRPISQPKTLKSFPMPVKAAPMPPPRKREIQPSFAGKPHQDRSFHLLKKSLRVDTHPILISYLRVSLSSRRIRYKSPLLPLVVRKPATIPKITESISFKARINLRKSKPRASRLLRTRKPAPWFRPPSDVVLSLPRAENLRRQAISFPPFLVDHPEKKLIEISVSRPSEPPPKSFMTPQMVGGLPGSFGMAWRRGLPKPCGKPVLFMFSPRPVRKAPIQLQVAPSILQMEMHVLEKPMDLFPRESVLERIEGGEHPLLTFALELDQEADDLMRRGKKEEAVEAYAEGAAALTEAGEVQGAAEMLGKALKCAAGSLEILKKLDRLQTQGAILRPEVKLEIQRRIYGLKI